ncbi:MAG: PIG-L deacetylase family protein [Bacteroidota bacterium]
MFDLAPPLGREQPLRLVCLGAHADDVEIGAGGTVLRLLRERPRTHVVWVVLTGDENRQREARTSAEALLGDAEAVRVETPGFRDGHLPWQGVDLKAWARETFADAFEGERPHLVLTTGLDDRHQDHRQTADLAWQTFRGVTIAEIEIPKWDGDAVRPNAFVRLDDATVDAKLAHLREHFATQRGKGWYDDDTFRATLRLRGVEAGCRWAEAFTCRKLTW